MAIELISLDVMIPRYSAMGLPEAVACSVSTASKRLVQLILGGALLPCPTASLNLTSSETRNGFASYLGELSQRIGQSDYEWLLHWMDYVYPSELNGAWSVMKAAMSRWAAAIWHRQVDVWGFTSDPQWLARTFRWEVVDHCERAGFGKENTDELSTWDLNLFKGRGYGEIPSGSNYIPFKDEFELSSSMFAFQVFVARRLLALPKEDLNRMEECIRQTERAPLWPGLQLLPGLDLVVMRCSRGLPCSRDGARLG